MSVKADTQIQLGDRVKDIISGYEGIAKCKTEWLYGCVRWLVQAEGLTKDGAPIAAEVYDEPQLKITKVGAVANNMLVADNASPLASPQKRAAAYGERDDKKAMSR